MNKKFTSVSFFLSTLFLTPFFSLVQAQAKAAPTCDPGDYSCVKANPQDIGFQIPSLTTFLSFAIRGAFIIAGLLALIFLITGAIAWVTSGGNKENVDKARDKITAAILGIIVLAGVLSIIVTLEQVVFHQTVCFGISCPLTIPSLLKAP